MRKRTLETNRLTIEPEIIRAAVSTRRQQLGDHLFDRLQRAHPSPGEPEAMSERWQARAA